MICRLTAGQQENGLHLVWEVFCDTEGAQMEEVSHRAFNDAIHAPDYLKMLTAWCL